VAAGE
jgi:hypothetical protein